jgi:hypothetical protein
MRRFERKGAARKSVVKRTPPSGQMTRSQAVSTFGVGSIFELRFSVAGDQILNSVIVAGLDEWPEDSLETIQEPTLQRALGVSYFCLPPETPDGNKSPHQDECVPAYRFPKWMVCSDCQTLGTAPRQFDDQRSNKPLCRNENCSGKGVPARLVTSCYSKDQAETFHPGHIDDFPWVWWAHSRVGGGECKNPKLKLLSTGDSAGLAGLKVQCTSCGASRTLEGVFSEGSMAARKCFGRRPWLNDEEECGRPVRVLMRGASNVYFPITASAISIPPYSERLYSLLSRERVIMENLNGPDLDQLVSMAMNMRVFKKKFTPEIVRGALEQLQSNGLSKPISEVEQKAAERRALATGTAKGDDEDQFKVRVVSTDEYIGQYRSAISCLSQVHRLREVRALKGFSRIVPATGTDTYSIECAPLSRQKTDWLPAIQVHGEGVYFELDFDSVLAWSQRECVKKRHGRIESRWAKSNKAESLCPGPQFILLHTLTHALINRLSLDCGYSSASLRERLYTSEEVDGWVGALIYTAVPGADGTLGGLVSQARPKTFFQSLVRALDDSIWCSSDPLCIDLEGQGADALNQAACHACVLSSETSCEVGNTLLDRAYLCGTDEDPDLSFFGLRD